MYRILASEFEIDWSGVAMACCRMYVYEEGLPGRHNLQKEKKTETFSCFDRQFLETKRV